MNKKTKKNIVRETEKVFPEEKEMNRKNQGRRKDEKEENIKMKKKK